MVWPGFRAFSQPLYAQNAPKRVLSLDMFRAIAIFGMEIFHSYNSLVSTAFLAKQYWFMPVLGILLLFGQWKGVFLVLAGEFMGYRMTYQLLLSLHKSRGGLQVSQTLLGGFATTVVSLLVHPVALCLTVVNILLENWLERTLHPDTHFAISTKVGPIDLAVVLNGILGIVLPLCLVAGFSLAPSVTRFASRRRWLPRGDHESVSAVAAVAREALMGGSRSSAGESNAGDAPMTEPDVKTNEDNIDQPPKTEQVSSAASLVHIDLPPPTAGPERVPTNDHIHIILRPDLLKLADEIASVQHIEIPPVAPSVVHETEVFALYSPPGPNAEQETAWSPGQAPADRLPRSMEITLGVGIIISCTLLILCGLVFAFTRDACAQLAVTIWRSHAVKHNYVADHAVAAELIKTPLDLLNLPWLTLPNAPFFTWLGAHWSNTFIGPMMSVFPYGLSSLAGAALGTVIAWSTYNTYISRATEDSARRHGETLAQTLHRVRKPLKLFTIVPITLMVIFGFWAFIPGQFSGFVLFSYIGAGVGEEGWYHSGCYETFLVAFQLSCILIFCLIFDYTTPERAMAHTRRSRWFRRYSSYSATLFSLDHLWITGGYYAVRAMFPKSCAEGQCEGVGPMFVILLALPVVSYLVLLLLDVCTYFPSPDMLISSVTHFWAMLVGEALRRMGKSEPTENFRQKLGKGILPVVSSCHACIQPMSIIRRTRKVEPAHPAKGWAEAEEKEISSPASPQEEEV